MRNTQRRLIMDISRSRSESFVSLCRGDRSNVFLRRRKMPLDSLLLSMMNRKGLTTTLEIRSFMNIAHPGTEISKSGYLRQRLKLNPEAFRDLYHFHNKNFYLDGEFRTLKGYLVLAADGSGINLPNTEENVEYFGSSSRDGTKPQAALGLGCIYDVLNRLILESECNRVKFNEYKCAETQMLTLLHETIGDLPYIIVMDRGYPNIPGLIHMEDNGIKYVIRLKGSDFRDERKAKTENDTDIEVPMTKARIRHYLGTPDGDRMKEMGKITLRIVDITLEDGSVESLVTNLSREEFSVEDLKSIYHARWKIETAYDMLKNRLQLENFTGTKPTLILQDIYATIYVGNLAQDIIMEAEQELDEKQPRYKHKMAINQTTSIGMLKNDLIYIILERDPTRQEQLFQKLYDDIRKNLVPIRPDRHYKRTKGQLAGKYSNTHKRAF